MDDSEAKCCLMVARQLAQRVHEYVREREDEHKQRDRFNRYPQRLGAAEAVSAVLQETQLDAFTAENLVKELGRSGAPQHALAVLNQVADGQPGAMSKHLFDAAISVCSTQFLANEAWHVFESMVKAGFHPDVVSCNMVIAAFSHGGDVAGVMRVLDNMDARGVKPNEYTGMSALQACLYKRAGRHEDAVCLVERLIQSSGQPASAEVADALLSVCEAAMDKSEGLDGAVAAFNSLRPLKLHACTRAYNALLRACAKRGQWQQAQVFYDEMLEADIKADTATLNSLIKACLTGGALQNALGIFEWMVSGKRVADDIPADIETYNTLIRACHQAGQLEKALEIMAWVQRSGLGFNDATYEELIGVTEIAEMWDVKAVSSAAQESLAVFPSHLRAAPYDAMRLTYLEHLHELEDEELLAAAKLGGESWVSSSLTKGDIQGGGKLPVGSAAFTAFRSPRAPQQPASPVPLVLSRLPSMADKVEGINHVLSPSAGLTMSKRHSHVPNGTPTSGAKEGGLEVPVRPAPLLPPLPGSGRASPRQACTSPNMRARPSGSPAGSTRPNSPRRDGRATMV